MTAEEQIAVLKEQVRTITHDLEDLTAKYEALNDKLIGTDEKPGLVQRVKTIETGVTTIRKVVGWLFTFVSGGGATAFLTWLSSLKAPSSGH